MNRLFSGLLCVFLFGALGEVELLAAGKGLKKIKPPAKQVIALSAVNETSVKLTQVILKNGKKTRRTKKYPIYCLDTVPGQGKVTGDSLTFTSLGEKVRYQKALNKRKKTVKSASDLKFSQNLLKAGRKACQNLPFRSLDAYRGQFGRAEAQILCNRFLIACSPSEVDRAVAEGLDAFVSRITTYLSEANIEEESRELRCDGRFAANPANEACDAVDPNDIYIPGVRYEIYNRILKSSNRFFEKLALFLGDDRGAVNSNALSSCEYHALPTYVDLLRSVARSGTAKDYCREIVKDHLSGIRYLHLDGSDKHGPNEDEARELMELQCMSPLDLDGKSVYGDQTVAQMALALTGWLIEGRYEYPAGGERDEYYVCRAGYFEGRHAAGPKTLFSDISGASPITVYDYHDAPLAIFEHPHTAEAWARDIWLAFINQSPSKSSLQELAAIIRENNYSLVPVMRRIMKSRALFAAESRQSLYKYPLEIVLGLALQTGIPVTTVDESRNYSYLDSILDEVGQRPLRAVSVFGWDEESLAGEFRVLDRRNVTVSLFNDSLEDLEELGYSFRSRFMQGLHGVQDPGNEMISRVARALGLELNQAQVAALDTFVNWNLESCWSGRQGCSPGQQYLAVRDAFDAHPDSDSRYEERVRDLVIMLAETPEYYVK